MPDAPTHPDLIRQVVFDAPNAAWVDALRRGPAADAGSLRVRRALGLPTDAAIIATGHQPGAWHAGIAAKELAADVIAERLGQAEGAPVVAAAITVDHQPAALTVRVPLRDASGELRAIERELAAGGTATSEDRAVGWVKPFEPIGLEPLAKELAINPDSTLLRAYHAALVESRAATSAAEQLINGIDAILAPVRRLPIQRYSTSTLAMTPEFGAFVRAMLDDPAVCVAAYNTAARAKPDAGITPLDDRDDANPELPLWLVDAAGRSKRAYAAEVREALANVHAETGLSPIVLPRALAMTGFIRRYAADVFIHGTGGSVYDTITEQWLSDWLGWRLAPMLVVTADVLLPIHASVTTEADLARARWLAHHAKHNPAAVGDATRDERKRALVRSIAAAIADSQDADAAYAELHDLLREHREANRAALQALDAEASAATQRLEERDLANDRSWPAALQTPEALRTLRDRLEAAVAAAC